MINGTDYLIFSGIGNPKDFKKLILDNNLNIVEEIVYPDHFYYKSSDIENIKKKAKKINAEIITTEKDFVKILEKDIDNIKFLEVKLKIEDEKKLINFIKSKTNV